MNHRIYQSLDLKRLRQRSYKAPVNLEVVEFRPLNNQRIARCMSEGIVDVLKAIEIGFS